MGDDPPSKFFGCFRVVLLTLTGGGPKLLHSSPAYREYCGLVDLVSKVVWGITKIPVDSTQQTFGSLGDVVDV